MKKLFTFFFLSISCQCVQGQLVQSLNENFNARCISFGANYPMYWNEYNTIAPVSTLAWQCSPTGGRDGSPGIYCSGFYSGAQHLDTAWLFTPLIDLSHYSTGNIYLRFDSKYEVSSNLLKSYVFLSRLDSASNPIDTMHNTYRDVSDSLSPTITVFDSLGWVTHQINLTPFVSHNHIYVAFMYVSSTSTAGIWTLDNINTSPFALDVATISKSSQTIMLSALYLSGTVDINYSVPHPGNYSAEIWDITGRQISELTIDITATEGHIAVPVHCLSSGIYYVKVYDNRSSGFTRMTVY
jgi:hypothetical protein